MTHYCKYHVLDEADWHCPQCRVEFCPTCSPDLPGQESPVHYCPLCNGELKRISASESAAPFWQHLTDFLRYPFSPLGLALLVLAFVVPLVVGEGLAAWIAGAVVLLVVSKYAWTALEQSSGGEIEPLGMDKLGEADNNELAIGAGIVLVLLAAAVGFLFTKTAVYGSALAVIVLAVLPALLIAIGVNRSVSSALNIEGIKSAVLGVGPVYAIVALFSVLLFATLNSLVSVFADILPAAWGRAAMLLACSYFVIVLFVFCGYLLLQYQEALGFTSAGGGKAKRAARKVDPAVIALEMFLKEGQYPRALGLLRKESERKGATIATHERYHRLILQMNDEQGLRNHAGLYFRMLLESGRDTQAVSLLRDYLGLLPGYRPEDPDLCYDLAVAFERLGDFKLAVHVLNGMHKDSAHYPRLPEAYLLAARLLAEKLALPQKGLALVQFLDGRFKTHASYPDIQKALREISAQLRPA
ncbi:MAG: hypothetical protein REI12_05435 [Pedobacter sp.]|nr:hypothetical protein [Pedobacter sp.]